MCGVAGRLRELELAKRTQSEQLFSLTKGLLLCFVAGLLSAVYGIAINDTGQPIIEVAAKYGAGEWQTNIVYVFANTGAFLTTFIYTIWLSGRKNTFHEFIHVKGAPASTLISNYCLALLTGCLWYSQFLFYGLGHVRMGQHKFSGWAIHMIMLILFSSFAGVVMREWTECHRRTKLAITGALAVLVGAVLMLTYGNYVGARRITS